ncbi:hypothetical protein K438DRAFT_1909486 [Mycena galopus ATCC 62051]|nr:hypothetical protein K438DRAFT_1909486 [Mycena galopus ATCC 62051]
MPVAPYFPTVVITIRALEIYRVARLRCPRLGIQAFMRALCDIHGVAPRPWLGTQFSVVFDLYLAIRARVEKRVEVALGRDTPNWRLKNACPACLYKLEDEPHLEIPLMATFDGNNLLSRFETREKTRVDTDGSTTAGASRERKDDRTAPGDYYLSREEVNKWAKDGFSDLMRGFVPEGDDAEDEGCTEGWQNMKEEVTARAYGMYDETGFFPALCRHGFVLVVVDMVKSGELAKYGLSITAHVIAILGEIAIGHDIGCKFAKLVKAHPLISKLATDNHFRALVGAFHGHGHNRRCAVENLMIYVKGVGTEALEGCESFFSKSNTLASTTRHASRFHRQQAITTYLKHTDTFDTYQGLSGLLCSKYRRALETKTTHGALLTAMRELGVESRDEFETWLGKEKAYLRTLSKEPTEETQEMEYYQKLVNLRDIEYVLHSVHGFGPDFCIQRGHWQRWALGDEKWEEVSAMVTKRRYQRALDHLVGLIVARMFELAKCGMAGTGYKLRKHIAKALQARSKAVRAAIERYNTAASAMTPQKPALEWDDVVEYAFLADFDLLRDAREDIRGETWAQPAGRAAMDQHFKLLRADEEILRLNVEIRRFVTYMGDEEAFLVREEGRLREEGKEGLAHQVALARMERAQFTTLHMSRLVKLSKEPSFTGDIVPGVSISRERHTPVVRENDVEMSLAEGAGAPDGDEDAQDIEEAGSYSDCEGDEDEEEILATAFLNVLHIASDSAPDMNNK